MSEPEIVRDRLRPWRRYRWRDAVTGAFVSKAYADSHPETTVRERVAPRPEPTVEEQP